MGGWCIYRKWKRNGRRSYRGNISGNDSLRDALRAHLLTSLHYNSGNSEQHMTTADQPGPHPELATQMYQVVQMHQSGSLNN